MKWLLYIFLLANLATFFWHYQPGLFRAETAQISQRAPDTDPAPQLVLLREYQSEQAVSQVAPADKEACFNLGPFSQRKEALQLNKELKALGAEATIQVTKDKTRPGYWVLIPPEKDRKTARNLINQLKEKKIRDYFLVATGSQKNAISLGVFSRPELAQSRLEMIKRLGFTVSIEKVDLPRREYWLEWSSTAGVAVGPEVLDRWHQTFPGIGSTKKSCHEKSSPG